MRKFIAFLVIVLFFSCKEKKDGPNISNIDAPLQLERFEIDLFSIDSNSTTLTLDSIRYKNSGFEKYFFFNIINADPNWGYDTLMAYTYQFVSAYRPIYDTAQLLFSNFEPYKKEIQDGLKRLKYYFPKDDSLPKKLITYIGPLNGYGDVLAPGMLAIGLHNHLGANASYYQTSMVREVYPEYITKHFTPETISLNALKNIIADRFPESLDNQSLSTQMIEKGKRLYLLERILPEKNEDVLIGYTPEQWKDCESHEAAIWQFFIQNNLLQNTDYAIIKNYIGESPKTKELGENAPGNIGSYCGWKMVKKFMDKFPETSLIELMKMSGEEILDQAKYKP
jgi:hypothetical protein